MKISKCKKELARIISENGGWRDGEFAAQDGDGLVGGYGSKPEWKSLIKYWWHETSGGRLLGWFLANKIKNHHQTVLSRAEYFHLYPEHTETEYKDGVKPTDPAKADGPSKPTIEQLAADYRNKLDYANRKQDEADKANMESDAALAQLEDAIAEIGFAITPLAATEKEPELVITDWRDLRVGDEIIIDYVDDYTDWKKNLEGKISTIVYDGVRFPVCATNESCPHGQSWFLGAPIEIKWRFIRRP